MCLSSQEESQESRRDMRKFARIFLRGYLSRIDFFPVCGKTSSKALVVLKEEMEKSSRGNEEIQF